MQVQQNLKSINKDKENLQPCQVQNNNQVHQKSYISKKDKLKSLDNLSCKHRSDSKKTIPKPQSSNNSSFSKDQLKLNLSKLNLNKSTSSLIAEDEFASN